MDPEKAVSPALVTLMRMRRQLLETRDRLAGLAERFEDLSKLYTDDRGKE